MHNFALFLFLLNIISVVSASERKFPVKEISLERLSAAPETLQKKYAKLVILQYPASLPNTMFGDPLHVNKKGTTLFSEITRRHLNCK